MFNTRQPFLLVIEPSITVRTIIDMTLRRNACTSAHVSPVSWVMFADPVMALRAIQGGCIPVPHIGLVCRDLLHLDGYEVIQYMGQKGYPTAFVVLLSPDQNGPLERIKAQLVGARTTLAKPFTVQQLLQAFTSTLG